MELKELIEKGSSAIRNDSKLMGFFINHYENTFAETPNCYGCHWNSVFKKLSKTLESNNPIIRINMKKTFVFSKQSPDIFCYIKNKTPHRLYKKDITDSFVNEYLTYGTESEIELRKTYFDKLPDIEIVEVENEIKPELTEFVSEVKEIKRRTRKKK